MIGPHVHCMHLAGFRIELAKTDDFFSHERNEEEALRDRPKVPVFRLTRDPSVDLTRLIDSAADRPNRVSMDSRDPLHVRRNRSPNEHASPPNVPTLRCGRTVKR